MTIETKKFCRKPIYVDGIQVTEANINQVARWCNGRIRPNKDNVEQPGKFIQVKVTRPQTPRQTKAFVGDWILSSTTGFKVYTDQALQGSFNEVTAGEEIVADNQRQSDYRSAETGRFVTEDYAEHNQSTTEKETNG